MNSSWPAIEDVGRTDTSPLASNASRLDVTSGSALACRAGASQNTRPMTAASCNARFWAWGRASMRAPSTARTVSGKAVGSVPVARQLEPSRTSIPPSIKRWMISSRKSGFPSAVVTRSRRNASGIALPSKISLSRAVLCCEVSARSVSSATASLPAPNSGWALRNSGRAVPTRRTGPLDRASSRSVISTRRSLAQCRSSRTRITGPAAA